MSFFSQIYLSFNTPYAILHFECAKIVIFINIMEEKPYEYYFKGRTENSYSAR